jgi:hypothetical protein
MNHLTEEDLILIYYNEPEARPEHLAECAECRAAASDLARVLNACNEWEIPEPSPALASRIKASLPAPVIPIRSWLYTAAAVAAVLLLAFTAGRYTKRTQKDVFAGLSPDAQHRILEISVADHLDRAELLLTEIANASDNDSLDRGRAQDLVDEGQLMRQSLARDGDPATLGLLDEVERFMVEAANTSETADHGELRHLRERLAGNSLLFKVRIIEANLRTQGQKS